ncbi:hypothetical protein SNL152K_8657 [Streptomyces sp. NL15-2K]|nr:hypothetical protein SNL152K_8657 [Streptomyces sp. NL15-2K]
MRQPHPVQPAAPAPRHQRRHRRLHRPGTLRPPHRTRHRHLRHPAPRPRRPAPRHRAQPLRRCRLPATAEDPPVHAPQQDRGPGRPHQHPGRPGRRRHVRTRVERHVPGCRPLHLPDTAGVARQQGVRDAGGLRRRVGLRRAALRPGRPRRHARRLLPAHRGSGRTRLGDRRVPVPAGARDRPRPHRGGQRHR